MLAEPEIHLARSDGPDGADLDALSAAERRALSAFRSEAARRERIAGRAVVRRRLAAWHGLAPADVPLAIGTNGRPVSPLGPPFSIAHGGGLVAVAFAPCEVGIDLEPLAPLGDDLDRLVRGYANDAEARAIGALPRAARERAFLEMWVRKESVLKATGMGLACDPRELDVRGEIVAFGARRWRLHALALGAAYVGALALEAPLPDEHLTTEANRCMTNSSMNLFHLRRPPMDAPVRFAPGSRRHAVT
ncbi:MAG TPA: 4'-phosphopantetheinyl transferase superfamily protein [Candidatus Limnocylindria bacterium]|jgi:4'-phosphopantetheinyl transferase|nr:4'-phosphopantetheinyl transferase superfamily protein [Candidatus Limnocylindria bacterium]